MYVFPATGLAQGQTCQSGIWTSSKLQLNVQRFNVGKNVRDQYLGIHAYCAWTNLNGSPLGGFQEIYSNGSNGWYVSNFRWGSYESGGTISVTCLNLPGAGL
ncbi:shufflon protein C [Salmonella enterica subsp. enterica serovar Saintpaul]|nr:shufflon protein C [Salmonella enterica subsp. enterica serovar Saintpaul]ECB2182284.1 shufflon protein C [Salmonella enterica subsp. enterica serovar Saintpaul]EDB2601759.1 shufflon protein C [Salmonella enterica]EDF3631179.1 shufflon protein C [Salmonella enterica]